VKHALSNLVTALTVLKIILCLEEFASTSARQIFLSQIQILELVTAVFLLVEIVSLLSLRALVASLVIIYQTQFVIRTALTPLFKIY